MFHRARKGSIAPQAEKQNKTAAQSKPQHDNNKKVAYDGMNQTAVKQYAKPQEEVTKVQNNANQNAGQPHAVRTIERNLKQQQIQKTIKEANQMNNAQPKQQDDNNQSTPSQPAQGRVDIPGQNFQRPGQAAPAQGSRPSYPGASYPGAQSNNSFSQANDADDNSRKLVIGQGITMSGEIESCDHLIVQGTIEASLKGANILDVAETGSYFGTVEIEEANIAGRFEGDITVKGRLTIESTGTIIGSVTYKELSMEAGATLDGSVSPIGSTNGTAKKAAPVKSKKVSQNSGAELPFASDAAE